MAKILIVEDEFAISQVLKAYLKKVGYDVMQCFNGGQALTVFQECQPDLVLLDIMLPEKNGWRVLEEIRDTSSCPIIMLTALGDVNYRLEGFDQGADDYIAKPFIADEVVARVKAVLRRAKGNHSAVEKKFGGLEIDTKAHRVLLNGEEIILTPRDLSVLLFLAEHPNQTFTRDQLIEQVWGWEYDGSDRAVDLAVKRLRKALTDWDETDGEIKTLRGLGYQLSVPKR
ncbi:response regulator transcription factor [Lysinibacillus pakistanensis]|uniref:Response regulator transcription factor n=1 Tax=Lysinibacillus pakistanensis TaxID=759811 RepID=A0AAX3WUT8_9BACI|nr:response regulator transcription factor [Lysinibacillus pakistanensis]MDM5231010.1 response regulator transcription factor [Lysinibacillus pakistanensis]WHY46573.1 response regulator transcription factor [Lysinibacillus pakistanensis]WHY51586.1 response regulator transcription factor [Lysinibacillus pakistanensis]